jgi:probable addiction module antidote protein
MNSKRGRDYNEELLESLQDPREAIAYLNAALIEDDPRIFLIALKSVLEAQGKNIGSVAPDTDLNRENLYRMLSRRDNNPKLSNIKTLLNAIGLELAIQKTR